MSAYRDQITKFKPAAERYYFSSIIYLSSIGLLLFLASV